MDENRRAGSTGDGGENATEFLKLDFEQCFKQLRFYDERISEVCKFVFVAYSTLIGAAFGLLKFLSEDKGGVTHQFWDCLNPVLGGPCNIIGLIFASGSLLGVAVFWFVVANRYYFVKMARYINGIRRAFLEQRPIGFQDESRMFVSSKSPAFFDERSVHSLIMFVVAIMNGLLLALALMLFQRVGSLSSAIVAVGFAAAQMVLGIAHLRRQS